MAWDFSPTEEQRLLVDTVRQFMAAEIFPHERETERLGEVPIELGKQIQKKSRELGLYAASMPAEVGGGGLDFVSVTLMDREIGKSTYGLVGWIGRPSEILNACQGDQRRPVVEVRPAGELAAEQRLRDSVLHAQPPNQPEQEVGVESVRRAGHPVEGERDALAPAGLRHLGVQKRLDAITQAHADPPPAMAKMRYASQPSAAPAGRSTM